MLWWPSCPHVYAGTVMTSFDHVMILTRGNWFQKNLLEHELNEYIKVRAFNRPFSYCIDQAGLGAFTAKSGRKHYNPPPLTVMWMNFDSPNFPSLCSLSAIISFQLVAINVFYVYFYFINVSRSNIKTVNMYGIFLWLVQSSSRWKNTLIATTMFNCWVFGSAKSVTRPDRDNQYNMRIVYNVKFVMNLHEKKNQMNEMKSLFSVNK